MYAIKKKNTDGLAFLTDTGQYLIWNTEQEAWRFLINEIKEDQENFTVIKIFWVKG